MCLRKAPTSMNFTEMNPEQLKAARSAVEAEYNEFKAKGLDLNMARGKPTPEQILTGAGILDVLTSHSDFTSEEGFDLLNYGCLTGLSECRRLLADVYGVPADKIIVGNNSSLTMMFDYLMQCYAKGASEETEPWVLQGDCKFLAVTPGYDRHFGITEYLGLEMINVPMTPEGPDMDVVEELVKDPSVKGMFCVPQYSNPTGNTYSDETVKRLASMETAPDFRIIWDNAYAVHDLTGRKERVLDMLTECEKAGHPERVVMFGSTSKISIPGAGIAFLAANEPNYSWIIKRLSKQSIGADKLNQMRHVLYFKDKDGLMAHMEEHASFTTPRFNIVTETFEKKLAGTGIASWTNPDGGYFISLDCMKGTASRVYELCAEAGVTLTPVGATFPHKDDPDDTNIRIAPTFPTEEDLQQATDILVLSVKLAALEKLMA